jgi:hypothetical protein
MNYGEYFANKVRNNHPSVEQKITVLIKSLYPVPLESNPDFSFLSPKIHSMKHLHIGRVGEQTTLAAIIAVLYFCAIMLFSYVFTLA